MKSTSLRAFLSVFVLSVLVLTGLAACSSSRGGGGGGGGGRSTSDARVRSFVGQVPPAYWRGGRWLKQPQRTAASAPKAQFVQFAFPS